MSVSHSGRSHRAPATSVNQRFRHAAAPDGDPMSHDQRTAVDIYQATRPMPNLIIR